MTDPFIPLVVPALVGDRVRLEPLTLDHVPGLAAAAAEDRSTYGWTIVPDGLEATQGYVEALLAQAARREVVPFAQVRVADGAPVGCTRYMTIIEWAGRGVPDEVEIGGTWLAASAQRGPVNTEAKYLLLSHAFDVWGVHRVELCTDARNERSRNAIERIGATFEGILRNHRPAMRAGEEGRARNSALFALIAEDWPAAKAALESRLGR